MNLWAGIDAGKANHHCVVIDADGNRLFSQKVPNDEPALLELIAAVLKFGDGEEMVWATDLNHGGPAPLMFVRTAGSGPRRRIDIGVSGGWIGLSTIRLSLV